jgi:hypothetical protein
MCYVLLKRSPFTPAEVQQARSFLDSKGFWALWLAGEDVATGTLPAKVAPVAQLVRSIVTTPPERRTALFRSAPIDIEPSTDDNPFYFVERSGPSRAAGEGVRVLLACLALLLALVLVFLLGPAALVLDRAEARSRPTRLFLLYCACLGTAFMLVEMELFHVFGLLLGNPTYALGTVLASLLVASGAGSLLAPRLAKSRHALLAAFTLLVAMLVGFLAAGPRLIDACITWPLSGRVAVSAALVGALGLAMGIPMTAGMTLVASRQALVSWGWTVNGAFSVVASVGALLLAIHFGIAVTFLFGVILYVAAAVVLLALRRGLEQDAGRT